MEKVAIYCRLSKEDTQKKEVWEESESIQNQKLLLTQFVQKKGWEIYHIYVDEDYSGLDATRPDFCRLLQDAENGCFQIVLCKSQSRFTRDMQLVEQYLHLLFPLWGIRFIGVVDAVDTGIKGNKKARQITGLVNEWYCEDLSENIRSVFHEKMKQGQFLAPFAPYGYEKSEKNPHQLVCDPEAAAVVKKIFSYYIQGMGTQQICHQLYEEKIPPPTVYKKQKGSTFFHPKSAHFGESYGLWSSSTIRRILTNQTYTGDLVQGTQRKVSYKSKRIVSVPRGDWVVIPHCHEPIISKKDFEFVQKRLSERRPSRKTGTTKPVPFFLSGMVRCAECGSPFYRTTGRNGTVYLYCPVYAKTNGEKCHRHSIREQELAQVVIEQLDMIQHHWHELAQKQSPCLESLFKENDNMAGFCEALISFIEVGDNDTEPRKIIIHWNLP